MYALDHGINLSYNCNKNETVMNIGLQEIFCCHDWAIEPIAGRQLYNALMVAIANHSESGTEGTEKAGFFLSKNKSFAGKLYVGDIHRIENRLYWRDEELAEDDQIINVVVIEGAVTRNGGACTYGSKEHRDQILYANTIPQVIGHLFLVNTPGGMVSAAPDYTMAIENCREMKKPTVSLVDGMCYSMGEWIACQTDYVIAMNPEDGFGCIGTMCCGELAPHGSINSITQERLFVLVGKSSPDKNREAIEASQGNDELMQEEADRGTERFHAVVKANRPMVTDDLLTGKTYPAREVMGKLVDEIGGMDRAIEVVFQLADGTMKPAREMEVIPEEPEEEPEADAPGVVAEAEMKEETVTHKNDNAMTDEEKKVAETEAAEAAVQETQEQQEATEATEATETGEATEATETKEATEAEETEETTEATEATETTETTEAEEATEAGELAQVTETLHNAESMIAEKDKEIASLKESLATLQGIAEERDAAVQERNDISASLEKAGQDYAEQGKQLSDAQAKIAEHVATIEKLTKQVADLKAEVKELSEKETPMVDAQAGAPAGNGTGEAPKYEGSVRSEVTADMSVADIRAKLRAKDEKQKTYRHK